MTETKSYRTGARAVRLAARETLLALRAARRPGPADPPARGGPVSKGKPEPAPAGDAVHPAAPFPERPVPQPVRPERSAPLPAAAVSADRPVSRPRGITASPVAAEVARAARAAAAGAVAVVEAEAETVIAPPAPPSRPAPAPAVPDLGPDSDLLALPGAGPGLVWLLGAAGIATLADLAAADAQDLRGRLGPVGQLLNLDTWIAWARGHGPGAGAGDAPPAA